MKSMKLYVVHRDLYKSHCIDQGEAIEIGKYGEIHDPHELYINSYYRHPANPYQNIIIEASSEKAALYVAHSSKIKLYEVSFSEKYHAPFLSEIELTQFLKKELKRSNLMPSYIKTCELILKGLLDGLQKTRSRKTRPI